MAKILPETAQHRQMSTISKIDTTDHSDQISRQDSKIESDSVSISSDTDEAQVDTKIGQATRLFADRVTVAGLEQAYNEKNRLEKFMWLVGYVLACLGIILSIRGVIAKVIDQGTVYDDFPVFNEQGPFPNVTICGPEASNKSKLREMLVVTDQTLKAVKAKNLSLDSVLDLTLEIWHINYKYANPQLGPKARLAFHIIDDTAPGQLLEKYIEALPPCEDMFSDCYFQGQRFECCSATRFVLFDGLVCYQINIDGIPDLKIDPSLIGGPKPDPVRMEDTGLVMNVSIDWSQVEFRDDLASDGFFVFIGPMASMISTPVTIPSNADALLALAPAEKINERTQCRSIENLPHLKYYEYYDPEGVTCSFDLSLSMASEMVGCSMGMYNYVPKNGTNCRSQHTIDTGRMVYNPSGNDDVFGMLDSIKHNPDLITQIPPSARKLLKNMLSMQQASSPSAFKDSFCPSLCVRWSYRILSASYNYIQSKSQAATWDDHASNNRTWSRIRVFFPESQFKLHVEKVVDENYMALVRIGGVLGVYLGISMITVVQSIPYGLYVIYVLIRHGRTSVS